MSERDEERDLALDRQGRVVKRVELKGRGANCPEKEITGLRGHVKHRYSRNRDRLRGVGKEGNMRYG